MIPAVAIAMFMASCGGVESDSKKVCDKLKEMGEVVKSGDKAKMEALQKEMEEMGKELEKKYPKGSEDEKKMEELIKPCSDEVMKTIGSGN